MTSRVGPRPCLPPCSEMSRLADRDKQTHSRQSSSGTSSLSSHAHASVHRTLVVLAPSLSSDGGHVRCRRGRPVVRPLVVPVLVAVRALVRVPAALVRVLVVMLAVLSLLVLLRGVLLLLLLLGWLLGLLSVRRLGGERRRRRERQVLERVRQVLVLLVVGRVHRGRTGDGGLNGGRRRGSAMERGKVVGRSCSSRS